MVNIDTVYQRVLAIANKEQRGYITPLEFNLLANQAQLVIFEQYFYDRNQTQRMPGGSINHSDHDLMLDEKVSIFERRGVAFTTTLPANLYRLDSILYRDSGKFGLNTYECTEVNAKDWHYVQHAPLLRPTNIRPIYIRSNNNTIDAHGDNNQVLGNLACNYIVNPLRVEWGYDVIGEKALYNANPLKTTHFEHHRSEETELVMRILELAGITIQDVNLAQYAGQVTNTQIQQEKS